MFTPRESNDRDNGPGNGPVKWWLWVFLGPDTACFVMDPTRSGAVLARHAGIDQTTGQLVEHPAPLVISSDFYSVYTSAGRKAAGLVNLYCWAQYAEPEIAEPAFGAAVLPSQAVCSAPSVAEKFRIIAVFGRGSSHRLW